MKSHSKIKMALALTVLTLGFCFGPQALEALSYTSADHIERAAKDTTRLLERYERSGDSREIRNWFRSCPSEAPRFQMFVTLGEWALHNKAGFVKIAEELPEPDRHDFLELLRESLSQSALWDKFKVAFQSEKSPVFKHLFLVKQNKH
jgi:hypothetical protein